jgi:hypothetical protein
VGLLVIAHDKAGVEFFNCPRWLEEMGGGSIRDRGDRAVFYSMIRKSGYRFSEKIMLKQEAKREMVVQLEIISF